MGDMRGAKGLVEEQVSELQNQQNPFVSKFDAFFSGPYKKQVERLAGRYPEECSLLIDYHDLEQFDYALADELTENPDTVLEAARTAVAAVDVPALEIESFSPHIRIVNLPQDQEVLIKNMSAAHLNKMIAVVGVVRQFNEVQPKLDVAVWKCKAPRCANTYPVKQERFKVKMPVRCECGSQQFELEEDASTFINHQKIGIQEPLETLKGGEQAASMDVHVTDDLVNRVAPGNQTNIVGILRLYPPQKNKNLVYGRYLEAVSIEEKEKEFDEIAVDKEEEEQIRKLSKRRDIYEVLTKSIAPSIYGHESVKESIALQLFSGVKKNLPGSMKVRGNIHVLLVGDPGVAKSQLLRSVDLIAPKSIYTSGKTTSGVGLTASAERDEFGEGGWTLKAGALVLASGGMAMIDEFDKMQADDRSAMHEAMEQGTISVAKAGIVTTFRTDTSVLAAANPKYSRFDPYSSPLEQIELPPTLISRFDLFFLIRDVMDRKKDEEIADFILARHQHGERQMSDRLHGKKTADMAEKAEDTPIISQDLFKKYVSFARQKMFPVMTDEAMRTIRDFYLSLREIGRKEERYTATHRQLEALVRLSEASARIRLKETVDQSDTERAIRIFRTSLEELAVDKETGKIDIDIISTGQSHSKVTAIKKILGIVKDLSEEREDKMAETNRVVQEAMTQGVDADKASDIIKDLKKKGDIYEPRHGFLKPTDRRDR